LIYCRWQPPQSDSDHCRFSGCCGSHPPIQRHRTHERGTLNRMYNNNITFPEATIENVFALVTIVALYRVSKSLIRISLVSRQLTWTYVLSNFSFVLGSSGQLHVELCSGLSKSHYRSPTTNHVLVQLEGHLICEAHMEFR